MADTYTQLYIQFAFVVQNRESLIKPEWEPELHKYITGVIQNKSHKMIAINGMPDHLHLFIGFQPVDHMSELIKVVKGESSKWIKDRNFVNGIFRWQEAYGAFSAAVISIGCTTIFRTRKRITKRKLSDRSTSNCLRSISLSLLSIESF